MKKEMMIVVKQNVYSDVTESIDETVREYNSLKLLLCDKIINSRKKQNWI